MNTKLNITRGCIKAVFLYGSEIGSKGDTEKTTESMDILLRRHLRNILCSKTSTANETLQLDAGWNRVETEILVRKIRLYFEVMNGERGTLANKVATVSQAKVTPLFREIEYELGVQNVQLLQTGDLKSRNTVIGNIRRRDHYDQLQRLEDDTPETTELYRGLTEQASFKRN